MTIPRLQTLRRLLISLLNVVEDELIERGVLQARTIRKGLTRPAKSCIISPTE